MDSGRKAQCWMCTAILSILCCLGLIIALIVVATGSKTGQPAAGSKTDQPAAGSKTGDEEPPPCGTNGEPVDLSEPDHPGPFHTLTTAELSRMMDYLYRQPDLDLVPASRVDMKSSYVYMAELFLPPKMAVLNFLDNNAAQPPRQAKATIFRGNKSPPVSEEYIVTLTEGAMSHELLNWTTRRNPVPYNYRPTGRTEYFMMMRHIMSRVDQVLGRLLRESYNATFRNCGDQCLLISWWAVMTSGLLETRDVRQYFLSSVFRSEFGALLPIDFFLHVDVGGVDPSKFTVRQVVYANQSFSSLEALADAYNKSQVTKTRLTFPERGPEAFSASYRRGPPVPPTPRRPPRLVEPDGRRFSVRHQSVRYMQWSLNVHVSVVSGPQLLDVRFSGERIAYELSLQEVVVLYSAYKPTLRHGDLLDSVSLLGPSCRSLVPQADCPHTAVFLDVPMQLDGGDRPSITRRAICIFEQNTGVPLRRHVATNTITGGFYYGLMDHVLVVRSIVVVGNYDYIVDFVLHQSGVLEVTARATGFLYPSFYMKDEEPYGFRLHDKVLGNVHHHLFNFKADLDILGTSNRYETLDIVPEQVDNSRWTRPGATKWQTKVERSLKRTELEAAYDFDFDKPKYHVVYNDLNRTTWDVPRAYRLEMTGMTKKLRPADAPNDVISSWARHQLVVTKHKEEERRSSCPYNQYATLDPILNFTQYYADDDNIVDEDLVLWASLGMQHIPHTEDLTMTPTPGQHVALTLLPHNYFPECPAMASRDALRIQLSKDGRHAHLVNFGPKSNSSCESREPDFQKYLDRMPCGIFNAPCY